MRMRRPGTSAGGFFPLGVNGCDRVGVVDGFAPSVEDGCKAEELSPQVERALSVCRHGARGGRAGMAVTGWDAELAAVAARGISSEALGAGLGGGRERGLRRRRRREFTGRTMKK